jgi:hypothetical protein
MAIVTTVTSSPGIDSNTVVELTTDSGVEIKRVETQWARVVTPGNVLNPATYQIVQRVTVESNWEPFYYVDGSSGATVRVLSTKLNSRKTTTELLVGTQCSMAFGFAWVQGGQFLEFQAKLQLAEVLQETYTWAADCSMASSTIERSQLYSPLALTIAGGFPGYTYEDGSIRYDSSYVWHGGGIGANGDLWRDKTTWPNFPSLDLALQGVGHLDSYRYYQSAPGVETFGLITPGISANSISAIAPIATPKPAPTTGSATIPQVFEEIVLVEFDATDATNTTGNGGYTKVTSSPGSLQYPENADELNAIAKRRIRRAMSVEYDITHNCIPFLRPGDHVALSNHARSLLNADVYVVNTKRTAAVLNAAMRQVSRVRRSPSWI